MKRREELYLVDLIEAARAIGEIIRGLDLAAFRADKARPSAVLWQLVIIGESASKLSAAAQGQLSDIPWDQIRAFRNRLVHGYFALDWDVVWHVAMVDIPQLLTRAERALATLHPETHLQLQRRRGTDRIEKSE
jgi:uncharacterized protein with HEPN domain